ncbi:MAG: hypothetical protein UY71_C0014G0007 [Parcubacteria group bacterium GW2011_GWB1_52_7]|nr:MAG: hypothetical protein UY71_C0014G0007 [Parcubacteria group bacterium GW2011_GWB1_52_7]KKW31402.1 MAG: hypothetical protein UY75_C0008G0006 [Parcubacteria group bacterium GW2011_GWC2_52_8c]
MSLDSLGRRYDEVLKNRAGRMYRRRKKLELIKKRLQPIGTPVAPVALREPEKAAAAVPFPPVRYRKLPACSQECAGCREGHHCRGKRCECSC